jgi:magnesium-transporting ATPase (P-type)
METADARRVVRLSGGAAPNPNVGFANNTIVTSKYTALNFAPKFLFESFCQLGNFYFLVVSCLQAVPSISNTNGIPVTAGTLAMILVFGAAIAGLEDRRRHQADGAANAAPCHVLDRATGTFVTAPTSALAVGDVLQIGNRDTVPADCAILLTSTHGSNPNCYVETKSLDGETNLKLREEVEEAAAAIGGGGGAAAAAAAGGGGGLADQDGPAYAAALAALAALRLRIRCEQPNDVIDKFEGVVEVGGAGASSVPLPFKSTLLRGCTVRNTDFVWALVLNTGGDTKIMMSNKEPPSKKSSLDKEINRVVIQVAVALMVLCAVSATARLVFAGRDIRGAWYLAVAPGRPFRRPTLGWWVESFFYFFLYMYQFIPISLYVSMSTVNLFGSQLMSGDARMYHAATDTPADVRTMDLQSELGQIGFVFSDKTGTLTQNVMEFRKCSIGGRRYGTGSTEIGRAAARRTSPDGKTVDATLVDDVTVDLAVLLPGARARDIEGSAAALRAFEAAVAAQFGASAAGSAAAGWKNVSAASIVVQGVDAAAEGGDGAGSAAGARVRCQMQMHQDDVARDAPGDDGPDKLQRAAAAALVGEAAGAALGTALAATADAAAASLLAPAGAATAVSARLNPRAYVNFADRRLSDDLHDASAGAAAAQRRRIDAFCAHLSLCHTVVPEAVTGSSVPKLSASSPDDQALVSGAAYLGFEFVGRSPRAVQLRVRGEARDVELLEVLDFNSTRKRMSVVVRVDGRLVLFAKGADTVIRERLAPSDDPADAAMLAATNADLEYFAAEGLRTLLVAERELDDASFAQWERRYRAALVDPVASKRHLAGGYDGQMAPDNDIDRLMEELESGLSLLGATAIEDKLQDGVPGCVAALRESGVKVWVLTGDKMSTAVNIAFACELLVNGMNRIELDGDVYGSAEQVERKLVEELMHFRARQGDADAPDMALVIDATCLKLALSTPSSTRRLLLLATRCVAFVGCRVSPADKAAVVNLVRRFLPDVRTLAIGDGANDVGMIQAAHVGVGISGQEGMQAVNNSDFAIAQFRYLRRLLLVHGRWSYHRMSKLCLYMFYKNIVEVLTQWWHIWYSAGSGQKYFNELGVQSYNMFFTSLPILLLATLDKDVDQPASAAEARPGGLSSFWTALYQAGPRNAWFSATVFWRQALYILWESVLIYACTAAASVHAQPNGGALSLMDIGAVSFTAVVVCANVAVAFELFRWIRWVSFASLATGVLAWFGLALLFSSEAMSSIVTSSGDGFWHMSLFQNIVTTGYFWLTLALVVATAAMARFGQKAVHHIWLPEMHNIVAEVQHVQRSDGKGCTDKLAQAHLYSAGFVGNLGPKHPSNPLRLRPNASTVLAEGEGAGAGGQSDQMREMSVMMREQQKQLDAHHKAHMLHVRVLSNSSATDEDKVAALEAGVEHLTPHHATAQRRSGQFSAYTGSAYEGGDRPSLRREASLADGQSHREEQERI